MKFKVRGIDTFASTGGRPFDKNKPLIIFVHGSGLSHMVWVLQTRYFAFRGYSVLAVDLLLTLLKRPESNVEFSIPLIKAPDKILFA